MYDAVTIPVLQDTAKVDFWQQAGGGLMLHDDLLLYDRCGRLFLHLCSEMSCRQMGRQMVLQYNTLLPEGYTTLRTAALLAAQASGCPCRGEPRRALPERPDPTAYGCAE